jgi:hypothetical protein
LSEFSHSRAALALVAAIAMLGGLLTTAPAAVAAYKPPPIKYVWLIDLENESSGYTFGPSGEAAAPYLTRTLPAAGALLRNYYGIGRRLFHEGGPSGAFRTIRLCRRTSLRVVVSRGFCCRRT